MLPSRQSNAHCWWMNIEAALWSVKTMMSLRAPSFIAELLLWLRRHGGARGRILPQAQFLGPLSIFHHQIIDLRLLEAGEGLRTCQVTHWTLVSISIQHFTVDLVQRVVRLRTLIVSILALCELLLQLHLSCLDTL